MKIIVNRKRGVEQWLETTDGENCPCLKDWAWSAFKPYPKPSVGQQKIAEWNTRNSLSRPEKRGGTDKTD